MNKSKIEERLPEPQPNQGINDDATSVSPSIAKPNVSGSLELLQHLLNREHKAYQDNIDNYMKSSGHEYNIETIDNVVFMIKELSANDR
jgi:hypothetical protein